MLISYIRASVAGLLCVLLAGSPAAAQQTPVDARPAAPGANDEAAQKAKIFASDCWRQAMLALDDWSRTQTIYTPDEVAAMRADFAARVDSMSARELQEMIADLEARFRILDSPEVREVRAWFAQYMSVLAERRREELLREIPNFATMTAAELNQAILKVRGKKAGQARFDRNRQAQVAARLDAGRAAPPAARQAASPHSSYRSPYRPVPRARPFDDAQVGPRRGMTVDPFGGVWMSIGF
jgi:hypothetical protein